MSKQDYRVGDDEIAIVAWMKASADLLHRLAAMEGQMEDLKGKVLAGLDAISPVAPLESPEEEIARAAEGTPRNLREHPMPSSA